MFLIVAAYQCAAVGHHVCPDLINIRGVGKVEHVGTEAAGGAHIDLKTEDIALLSKVLLILIKNKEFEMDETAVNAKGLNGPTSGITNALREIFFNVIAGVSVGIDDVHDGINGYIAGFKDGRSIRVDDCIIAVNGSAHEFFHDIGLIRLFGKESSQILIAGQLIGVRRTNAVIRLYDDRIANRFNKGFAPIIVIHNVPAGCLDPGLIIIGLHGRLILDRHHIIGVESGGDIECCAQRGIPLKPVFIVGFQPVDAAVLVNQESNGTIHLIVIFKRADLEVLGQTSAQFRHKLIIRAVTDAENPDAVFLKLRTEFPIVCRKIRRDKNEILHSCSLNFLYSGLAHQERQVICCLAIPPVPVMVDIKSPEIDPGMDAFVLKYTL